MFVADSHSMKFPGVAIATEFVTIATDEFAVMYYFLAPNSPNTSVLLGYRLFKHDCESQ